MSLRVVIKKGSFLPPCCVFKGKRKRDAFERGSVDLFLGWMTDKFVPRRENSKVHLILYGHSSHCSDVAVLDHAHANDIMLMCLPSHTMHYALQPLDRSLFKPLKTYWQRAVLTWVHGNAGKQLRRYHYGNLLNTAWVLAATAVVAGAGFRACGIYPYDPQSIPQHAHAIADNATVQANGHQVEVVATNPNSQIQAASTSSSGDPAPSRATPNRANHALEPQPSTSFAEVGSIPAIPMHQATCVSNIQRFSHHQITVKKSE